MIFFVLQSIGLIFGIGGAILTASGNPGRRRQGFLIWIFGNVAMLLSGLMESNYHIILMFGFYAITALTGWKNNREPDPGPFQVEPDPGPFQVEPDPGPFQV